MANQMGNKQSSRQDLVFEDYSKRNFICPNESIRCDFSLEPVIWLYRWDTTKGFMEEYDNF